MVILTWRFLSRSDATDATPLYLITLHAAWRATGDQELLEQHLQTAEGCLAWIDKYGDRDGDGFQEYQTRSSAGYENMGWKDSGDSVMYPDGSLVKGPKALCELQGYVYSAWIRMAEVFDTLGKADRATVLRAKAALCSRTSTKCSGTRNSVRLAARQRHHRNGLQILWLSCGGGAGRA